jgi:hypothetical protein
MSKKLQYASMSVHRYVWEQVHGPIPKGYHVHHRDGDANNNSIENLEVLTCREHSRIHAGWLRDVSGQFTKRRCPGCSQFLTLDAFYTTHGKPYGRCKACTAHRKATRVRKRTAPPKTETFVCERCGMDVPVALSHKGRRKFCTLSCAVSAQNMDRVGRLNTAAKLTDEAVQAIREQAHVCGCVMAKRYGVSNATISGVRKHLTWKHIP